VSLSIETGIQSDQTVTIALSGEVDYTTAQQFREAVCGVLTGGHVRGLIIDLARVSFLDSTGVGSIVVARRICTEFGVRLQLRDVNPFIARLFSVLGVSDLLGVPVPGGVVVPRLAVAPRPRGVDPLAQPA
jgi:anti-sigma B factor antagonist